MAAEVLPASDLEIARLTLPDGVELVADVYRPGGGVCRAGPPGPTASWREALAGAERTR